MQLQRAARGPLGRGGALARIAELGGAQSDVLASDVTRLLGETERSFRRKQAKAKDWRSKAGGCDTRGGGVTKKASSRSIRRTAAGSTKEAAPKTAHEPAAKPKSKAAAKPASKKSTDRTAKLVRGGPRPMYGELSLGAIGARERGSGGAASGVHR